MPEHERRGDDMKVWAKPVLFLLLLAIALIIASCGRGAGTSDGDQGHGMKGVDYGKSGDKMAGLDHEGMGSGRMSNMSRKIVMPGGKYSDAAFVDSMILHHEGAIEMAEIAVKNADHEEIRHLSHNIISSQQAEIRDLKGIRKDLDGHAMKMSDEDMSMMGMMEDPRQLADARPYDKAFIDHMIPHHESAIAMSQVALEKSKNPSIKEIAGNIVTAQRREIQEMKQWRREWYPED